MTVDLILVRRLKDAYWPAWCQAITEAPERVFATKPVVRFLADEHRGAWSPTNAYHLGRVHYFIKELRRGASLDPIEVETRVFPGRSGAPPAWGGPEIVDGHHRFIAAVLAYKRRVAASCGGLVTTIVWLRGDVRYRQLPPEVVEVVR